jgi:hypothetical protein
MPDQPESYFGKPKLKDSCEKSTTEIVGCGLCDKQWNRIPVSWEKRMSEDNRPYPEGICWDEAWRQRQRADMLQGNYDFLVAKFNTQVELSKELEHRLRAPFGAGDVRVLQSWLGVTGSVMTDESWEKLDDSTRRLYVLEVVKMACQ